MSDWEIFKGDPLRPHSETERLRQNPPPWRDFGAPQHRGKSYLPSAEEVRVINAALHLRRPVLITGQPGSGKSSLAYAVAEELQLGPVLKWPINSRSTLTEGLYNYDAIGRLREVNLRQHSPAASGESNSHDIEQYLQLQWLGTALASTEPRVLLIDEIDKADIDLPNDLLHVLEEGTFAIPELRRIAAAQAEVELRGVEPNSEQRYKVKAGVVRCTMFPLIIMTSNGERELPLALHRRCLRIDIKRPDKKQLEAIVRAHLEKLLAHRGDVQTALHTLIDSFDELRNKQKVMATDQLLNMVFLCLASESRPESDDHASLEKLIFRALDE